MKRPIYVGDTVAVYGMYLSSVDKLHRKEMVVTHVVEDVLWGETEVAGQKYAVRAHIKQARPIKAGKKPTKPRVLWVNPEATSGDGETTSSTPVTNWVQYQVCE